MELHLPPHERETLLVHAGAIGVQDEFCRLYPQGRAFIEVLKQLAPAVPSFSIFVGMGLSIIEGFMDVAAKALCAAGTVTSVDVSPPTPVEVEPPTIQPEPSGTLDASIEI